MKVRSMLVPSAAAKVVSHGGLVVGLVALAACQQSERNPREREAETLSDVTSVGSELAARIQLSCGEVRSFHAEGTGWVSQPFEDPGVYATEEEAKAHRCSYLLAPVPDLVNAATARAVAACTTDAFRAFVCEYCPLDINNPPGDSSDLERCSPRLEKSECAVSPNSVKVTVSNRVQQKTVKDLTVWVAQCYATTSLAAASGTVKAGCGEVVRECSDEPDCEADGTCGAGGATSSDPQAGAGGAGGEVGLGGGGDVIVETAPVETVVIDVDASAAGTGGGAALPDDRLTP